MATKIQYTGEGNFKELVHYSTYLENSLIGLCLIEVDRILEVMSYIKTPDVIYSDINRIIFEAMLRLARRGIGIDLISVPIEIENGGTHDRAEFANVRFDVECMVKMKDVTGGEHLTYWCMYLIQFYVKREQIKHALNIWSYSDPLEAARELQERIGVALSFNVQNDWSSVGELMQELFERREKIQAGKNLGVPTGFAGLDRITGGGFDTGLIFIFARPGGGKTAFALSLALNIARIGHGVGIISLEMPHVQLMGRLLAQESKTDFKTVFKGSDTEPFDVVNNRLKLAANNLERLNIFISNNVKVDIHEIKYHVKKIKRQKDVKIIFIDYLQLVEVDMTKGKPRYVAVGELTRDLKLLSTEEDIPIVILGQVNRESEGADKQSKPPKLSQARESGNIEQDVDMGIGIDRPYSRGILADEHGNSTEFDAFIDIQKHRNGALGVIPAKYDPQTMRFYCPENEAKKQLEYNNPRVPPTDRSTPPKLTIETAPF